MIENLFKAIFLNTFNGNRLFLLVQLLHKILTENA